ncbi:MAG: prolyl oligopeptidase family serine peptidase [Anaerolineae bacterium]|nr:prolyl oligopeptidase family serine peptidase [Anaerolineae bacterium]
MKRALLIALGWLLCAGCALSSLSGGARPSAAGDFTRSLVVDGQRRTYQVHIPPSLDPAQPAALVLVFHGGGGNAESMARVSHFSQEADRSGFVVVYPNGNGRLEEKVLTWNGGACCGYAQSKNIDDVGFVRALIADLETLVAVDPKRIYATGISNGGIFSYRLACDAAPLFAAVASVAGTLNYSACAPSEPLAVLHIHGTADAHLPYNGGVGEESRIGVDFVSVPETIRFWTQANGCPAQPQQTRSGSVVHDIYAPCRAGAVVELYTIEGGLHAWPGGIPAWQGGDEPSMEMDATAVIWQFFAAHPKP